MSVLELAVTVENLQFELGQLHGQLEAGPGDGRLLIRLGTFYRQLGCAQMLGDLDAAACQDFLFKSARCYEWLLRRPPGTVDPYYLCRGRGAPLLDAIAAGRLDVAQRIASLMRAPFTHRMEPEEDFRWFELLGEALVPGTLRPDLLRTFEVSLEGKRSARFDAAEALQAGDGEAFAGALRALSREWPGEAERRTAPEGPYFAATEAHICIEAVALARLAVERGIAQPRRLRFVPDELLGPVKAEFPESFAPCP
jgi:hypothetical protein